MPASNETLRRELQEAFQNRAHLYRLMLQVLRGRYGASEAEVVLADVCERRGREVAQRLFEGLAPEPEALARRFLSVSPDDGCLYPHAVEAAEGSFTITVHRCPLKDAWLAADLPGGEVATLCRIAGAFDRGLFEAGGVGFAASTWSEARGGGCCQITLTRLQPAQGPASGA